MCACVSPVYVRWGMHGSKTLYHARAKVKSSYGKELRSGMVIRVTLDTDAGTLSYVGPLASYSYLNLNGL
jgi:hypothetical protein